MVNTSINRWFYKRQRRLLKGLPPVEYPQLQEDDKTVDSAQIVIMSIVLCGVMLIGGCITAKPVQAEVTDEQAVKILVGEASNQGLKGMICVAEVLRTRNSVNGFYGLNAKHSHKEPAWVWAQARKAWEMSANTHYTQGADHFENILAFGKPCWVKNCVETFRYGAHVFYKEIA